MREDGELSKQAAVGHTACWRRYWYLALPAAHRTLCDGGDAGESGVSAMLVGCARDGLERGRRRLGPHASFETP